ncbi:Purine catabolism protein PucB [Sporomusa carbonis]|uniref:nucleotidyltransferase family protein n=1 Tax=Sporomusa carbonis TaxID=3076075 RepID=UPI003A6F1362
MNPKIGAVILAAGTASRMGRQKLLLPLSGKPLLAHVLNVVHGMSWADCVAVIGEPQDELAQLCGQYNIRTVYNAARHSGQASSIVLAMNSLSNRLDGVIFFLGDQPLISPALILALTGRYRQAASNKAIIVPCRQGRRYSPVLFGSHWRPGLAALAGDTGGRQIIKENPGRVISVDWPDPRPFYDADTWDDYLMLQHCLSARHSSMPLPLRPENIGKSRGDDFVF